MRSLIRASRSGIFLLTLLTLTGTAQAQFNQYTAPGGPEQRPVSRKEELAREVEEARFRLGPVRVDPWFSIRDFAYVRNLLAEDDQPASDLTATVGAGLRAYLPTGSKVTWTAEALPEYVWWADREDRRRVNGRFGVGTYAYFNRMTIEATAGREQEQQFLTPEVPQLVDGRADRLRLDAETEVSGAFSLFTSAAWSEQVSLASELDDPRTEALELLDRQERVLRAVLRWSPRRWWRIGLGAERSQVDFDNSGPDRSNQGTAPVFELQVDRERLFVLVELAARSLAARQGSDFPAYDSVTGNAGISFGGTDRIEHWLYASRNLAYSLFPSYAYYTDERVGASLNVNFGRRVSTRFFAEIGNNDYTVFSSATAPRNDDLVAYGTATELSLGGPVVLILQAVRSEFESNLPGADRSYTTAGVTLVLLGER